MLDVLCTKNHSPLSYAIRGVTGEPGSHIAFVFSRKHVVHSNLYGVHEDFFKSFLHHNTVVKGVSFPNLSDIEEDQIWESIMDDDEAGYDFTGFLYLAKCLVEHRLYGKPIPAENAWGKKRSFMCQEMIKKLPNWIVPPEYKNGADMKTPWDVINYLALIPGTTEFKL